MEEERREGELRAQVVVEEGEEDEEEEEEEEEDEEGEENESNSEEGRGRGGVDSPLSDPQSLGKLLYLLLSLLQLALLVREKVVSVGELLSELADRADTTHCVLPPLSHLRKRRWR